MDKKMPTFQPYIASAVTIQVDSKASFTEGTYLISRNAGHFFLLLLTFLSYSYHLAPDHYLQVDYIACLNLNPQPLVSKPSDCRSCRQGWMLLTEWCQGSDFAEEWSCILLVFSHTGPRLVKTFSCLCSQEKLIHILLISS